LLRFNLASEDSNRILLTGATGYVGGRLLPLLLAKDCLVRCLTRRTSSEINLDNPNVEFAIGNALDLESLNAALKDVDTAYYFIHSMGDIEDFEKTDRKAAQNFAAACSAQGVKRIIYLGGLGDPSDKLSKHLRSRQEIGDILRTSNATVIEFQASIIIGSGSLSFEMIRALVERLPVMICPKWVRILAQPISIEDVLEYLVDALDHPTGSSELYEIGGPEQVSYGQIMHCYANLRGLRRFMIPVPFLTPYLSSLWLGLVTPLYSRVGRKLVDSLRNPTLVSSGKAREAFSIDPRSVEDSIARALVYEDKEFAETRWSGAFSAGGDQKSWGGVRIRGFLDLLVGGVGVRRGRRDPNHVRVGDTLDFWRVEQVVENKILRLAAEMKVPGRAWLEFEVTEEDGISTVRQTAIFDPVGLFGIVYWYSLFPLHEFVFRGMLRNICKAAKDE